VTDWLPIIGLCALFFACGWLWRQKTMPPPETVERVEILYRPPNPEFIEAFRLQCVWVER